MAWKFGGKILFRPSLSCRLPYNNFFIDWGQDSWKFIVLDRLYLCNYEPRHIDILRDELGQYRCPAILTLYLGSREGTMARMLASHQYCLGSVLVQCYTWKANNDARLIQRRRLASLFAFLSIFGWSDLLQILRKQTAFSFTVLCILC